MTTSKPASHAISDSGHHADSDWFLDDEEPYSLVPRADAPANGVAYADLPRRAVAFALDLVMVQVLTTMALELGAFVTGSTLLTPTGVTDRVLGAWLGFGVPTLIVAVLEAVAFVYFWRVHRASPGQIVLGLFTVRNADGDRLSKRRGLLRWLLTFLPAFFIAASSNLGVVWGFAIGQQSDQQGATGFALSLPLIWFLVVFISMLINPRGRGLNDRLAGSVVVRREG